MAFASNDCHMFAYDNMKQTQIIIIIKCKVFPAQTNAPSQTLFASVVHATTAQHQDTTRVTPEPNLIAIGFAKKTISH